MRPYLHICLLCTLLKNGDRLPVPVYFFCSQIFPPASTTPPSPAQTSASLSRSPHKKYLPKPHLAAGYGGRHATPGRACGRSRRVSSHPRFGSAVRRSYRQAEGAEVDERKINLREEGNENNTGLG